MGFLGLTDLTCESPYAELNGAKVHLYDRSASALGCAVPTSHTGCFASCASLSDYNAIPFDWK